MSLTNPLVANTDALPTTPPMDVEDDDFLVISESEDNGDPVSVPSSTRPETGTEDGFSIQQAAEMVKSLVMQNQALKENIERRTEEVGERFSEIQRKHNEEVDKLTLALREAQQQKYQMQEQLDQLQRTHQTDGFGDLEDFDKSLMADADNMMMEKVYKELKIQKDEVEKYKKLHEEVSANHEEALKRIQGLESILAGSPDEQVKRLETANRNLEEEKKALIEENAALRQAQNTTLPRNSNDFGSPPWSAADRRDLTSGVLSGVNSSVRFERQISEGHTKEELIVLYNTAMQQNADLQRQLEQAEKQRRPSGAAAHKETSITNLRTQPDLLEEGNSSGETLGASAASINDDEEEDDKEKAELEKSQTDLEMLKLLTSKNNNEARHSKELEKVKRTKVDLEADNENLRTRLNDMERKSVETNSQLSSLRKSCNTLEQEKRDLDLQVSEKVGEVEKLKRKKEDLEAEIGTLRTRLNKIESNSVETNSHLSSLRKSCSTLEQEKRDLDLQVTEKVGEVEKLQLQVRQLMQELHKARSTNKIQTSAAAMAEDRRLRQQVTLLEQQIDKAEMERDELRNELSEKVRHEAEQGAALASAEAEKERVQKQLDDLHQELAHQILEDGRTTEIGNLKEELQNVKKERDELVEQMESQVTRESEHTAKLESLCREVDELERDRNDLLSTLAVKEDDLRTARTDVESCQLQLQQVSTELGQLLKDHAAALADREKMQSERQELRTAMEQASEQVELSKMEAKTYEEDFNLERRAREEAAGRVDHLTKELTELREENDLLLSELRRHEEQSVSGFQARHGVLPNQRTPSPGQQAANRRSPNPMAAAARRNLQQQQARGERRCPRCDAEFQTFEECQNHFMDCLADSHP